MPADHGQTSRHPRSRPILFELRSSTGFIVLSASVAYFQDGFLYASVRLYAFLRSCRTNDHLLSLQVVPVLPFSLHERSGIPHDAIQFWNSTFLAIFGVFQVLGGPVVGWWADHSSSRRLPYLFGLICAFAATILFMVARSIWILVIARVVQGIAAAIVNTLSLALLADTVEKDQLGFWMGLALSGMTLGVLLAPPLAAVVYERAGYAWVFVMALVIVGIDMILRFVIIEKKDAKRWIKETNESSASSLLEATPADPDRAVGDSVDEAVAQIYGVASVKLRPAQTRLLTPHNRQHPDEATSLLDKPALKSKSSLRQCLPTSILLLTSPTIAAAIYGCVINATLVTAFDASLPIFVAEAFSWSAEKAGVILLALTIPPLLGFIPGALADRYGPSRIAMVGFVLSTLCILFMGMIDTADVVHIVLLIVLLFFTSRNPWALFQMCEIVFVSG